MLNSIFKNMIKIRLKRMILLSQIKVEFCDDNLMIGSLNAEKSVIFR